MQERKVVTALFADLVGFSGLAERLDPEQLAAVQEEFWEHVRGELERRSGTVEKYVGDAVLGLFGARVAHEDDGERAVRAALAIRDWPRFEVRIGIATGDALIRLDADAPAGEGIAVGDVVNTAARLQQAAPVDAVLVDEATYAATCACVDYEAVDAVDAKGKSKPVAAWKALAARAPARVLSTTPFVGRATELALLHAVFERVVGQGSPQLVTIVGPPGIGKTRLVRQFRSGVGAAEWLCGRAPPYDEGAGSLSALAECIRRHVGIASGDPPAVAEQKVARALASSFDADEVRRLGPHVRVLVGLEEPPDPLRDDRVESFAAWRRFLEAIAARRPLVVALDDLQWAEPLLLEFLDHVVEWAVQSPLLVLCTARPELLHELRPTWGAGQANTLTMSLGPLSGAETTTLLAQLLGRDAVDVPSDLCARSGGNPLYAEQFSRIVSEGGDGAALPRTVQAVIGARIDGLRQREKQVLEDAAVVGDVFWPGALGIERDDEALHALERKELIVRAPSDDEYSFRHSLLRDVAYGRVPRLRRVERHAAAAEWLGRRGGDVEGVAHHLVAALAAARGVGAPTDELELRTRRSLRAAGERAIALNAYTAAVAHLRAAIDLWPPDDSERARLELRLGHALWMTTGGGEQELRSCRGPLRAAGDRAHEAEAECLLCQLYWHRGELARSWRHLDTAASLVENEPATPQKADVLARLARQLMLGAAYGQAIAVGRQALEIAEQLGLDELRSSTLNSIGSARTRSGDLGGIADVERAVEISLAATSSAAVVAYNNLSSLHGELGDLRRSREYHERARDLAAELGDRRYLEWSDRELALLAYQAGDPDAVCTAAARIGSGEPHYLDALIQSTHALVLQASGEVLRADEEVERAEAAARGVGDPQLLLACLGDIALLRLIEGRADDAQSYADEIAALAAATGYLPPATSYPLALVFAASGRTADFVALLDDSPQRSRWFDAARAIAAGELAAAAGIYAEIGDASAARFVRLRAPVLP